MTPPARPRRRPLLLLGALAAAIAVAGGAIYGCAQLMGGRGGHPPAVLPILDPPVMRVEFSDPFMMRAPAGGLIAFATQGGGAHVQVARAPDLLHWALARTAAGAPVDALPHLPAWVDARRPDVWAPEVMRFGATYVLYFSARSRQPREGYGGLKECIGAATSPAPEGPYAPQPQPLVCAGLPTGVIDPSPFRDGRRLYLYFKRDGNCCGRGSGILVQDLARDGLSVTGVHEATGEQNDRAWEGTTVEAPTMWKRHGRYFLFYSGAYYGGAAYAVGYARCRTPTGHCADAPENPILASRQDRPPRLVGPGHQSLLRVGDRTFISYHAWEVRPDGRQGRARFMHVSEVLWRGGKPVISGLQRPLPSFPAGAAAR